MSDEKLQKYAKQEREFLHDISTPIMIAMGHLEYLMEDDFKTDLEKTRMRVEKSFNNLQKLSDRLHERRKVLHKINGVNS